MCQTQPRKTTSYPTIWSHILLFLDVRVTTDNDRSNCLELVAIADHTLTFSQYEVYDAILLKQ